MRKLIYDKVIILSAELSDLSKSENDKRSDNLRSCLQDLNMSFNRALGVYRGHFETSFVVRVNNLSEIEAIEDLAFKSFGQESVLFQDSKGKASLKYSIGEYELLGELRQITEFEAKLRRDYTYMNDNFYGIV